MTLLGVRPARIRLLGVATAALVLAGCGGGEPALEYKGPDEGALLNGQDLAEAAWEVHGEEGVPETVRLALDGQDVDADRGDTTLRWAPQDLDDGEYTLAALRQAPDADEPEVLHEWAFAVDATPPEIELTSPDSAVVAGEPVSVAGTTEPGATVSVAGQETTAGDDGGFAVELPEAPEGDLEIVAVDAAGNASDDQFTLVTVPSRVEVDHVRSVHVTPHAWATDSFRERILQMADDGIINSVALTLKDEGGRIGWNSEVELAIASGANEGVYDLEATIAALHERGIHVAGRIVAFRDPMLGPYARDNGDLDWLVQTTDGEPYTGRYECCFTNFSHPEVIEYNLAIAEEAARAGVDDILWDYIRKPDGPRENLVLEGIPNDEPLEPAIIEFTRLADERLSRYGVGHGASLYGIAADRPTQIAQDVPGMSEYLDYVAPMIYPSHWGPGEYGVADPNRQPYDIIDATLEVWKEQVEGTDTRIVPWLEDTTYRAWDRPHQVREQIRAARDHDIQEFLMWDPSVRYTLEAYDTIPRGREE
ncbi:putative glycoside hydrolase [Egicoccus sp. AB-alg2]|uniref:putative glycoside hydrolase n=1 Tax=Egicoccus sp. AB-alg2 TaxID=3242693 RepID=UPI00359E86DA